MFNRKAKANPLAMVLTCALTLVLPVGCGGNGAGAATGATMSLPPAGTGEMRAARYVGGEYSGMVADDIHGAGHIDAEISQYQNAAGGILTITFGSTALITPASFLVSGARLIGRGNFSVSGSSGVCTFSETASYRSGHHLDGTYRAVHGCPGETGTFMMKEKCQYILGSDTAPDVSLKPC